MHLPSFLGGSGGARQTGRKGVSWPITERWKRGGSRGLEGENGKTGGRERAGHIEEEHWPGALLRAAPPFSPFFGGRKRTKTHFPCVPMGEPEPAVPHIAVTIWPRRGRSDGYWITMSVARCPVMPAPSHTHNKHTPSPVRLNHTTQREHINYRCTLNYFHYLPLLSGRDRDGDDGWKAVHYNSPM